MGVPVDWARDNDRCPICHIAYECGCDCQEHKPAGDALVLETLHAACVRRGVPVERVTLSGVNRLGRHRVHLDGLSHWTLRGGTLCDLTEDCDEAAGEALLRVNWRGNMHKAQEQLKTDEGYDG